MDIRVYCAYDEMVDIDKLVPNPRNPNKHPQKQIDLLAKIIKYQGWRVPITVSKRSGFVVRGHGRLMAAQKLGLEKVPVDFQDYANEAEEWADLIADNRIAELAEMDDTMLKDLLQEIDTGAIDMELTGFTAEELEQMMTALSDEEAIDKASREALMRRRVKIAWDRFLVFHACVGDQIYCMDKLNYLISFGAMEGKPPRAAKPPNSVLFVDSGLLTGARKEGRLFLERQEDVVEYALKCGADWVAMMDVPMIPPVLEALNMTREVAYRIHLRNAEQFAAMDIPIRKVFVVQGPDLEDYDRCCRDMQGLVGTKDVVAIGSIKDRAADLDLIAQITALVKKHFPQNDIHLFGVSSPRTVAKAAAYGATSCDSASAGLAVGLGGVLIANKTDNGWMAKKYALADLMGEPDLSIGNKLWMALTAFSMAQAEAAIAMSMVQEEAAILLEMGATDEEVVEAEEAEREIAAELEKLVRRDEEH